MRGATSEASLSMPLLAVTSNITLVFVSEKLMIHKKVDR